MICSDENINEMVILTPESEEEIYEELLDLKEFLS